MLIDNVYLPGIHIKRNSIIPLGQAVHVVCDSSTSCTNSPIIHISFYTLITPNNTWRAAVDFYCIYYQSGFRVSGEKVKLGISNSTYKEEITPTYPSLPGIRLAGKDMEVPLVEIWKWSCETEGEMCSTPELEDKSNNRLVLM